MQSVNLKRLIVGTLLSIFAFAWAMTPALAERFFNPNRSAGSFSQLSLLGGSDLWPSIRRHLAFVKENDHPAVAKELKRFSSDAERFNRIAVRAEPYLYYVHQEIKRRGLPSELALLPFIESGYNPKARSSRGALGIWQFMPQTGKQYGLTAKNGYDGRRDVVASTRAALDHLTDLYREFNQDWLLAIAAYNSGPGNVRAAIKRNQKAGLKTDFWSLSLPQETKNYVPRLLALAQLVQSPEKHQIQLSKIPNKPYFMPVDVKTVGLSLSQLAQRSGLEVSQLHDLNPGYSSASSQIQTETPLLIPFGTKASLIEGLWK